MSDSIRDSRQKILVCAARLFAKLGLDKCSTRDIAKKSDSNISLISYYFGGKEGLYKEVMRSYALEVRESSQKVLDHSLQNSYTREAFIVEIGLILDNMIHFRTKHPDVAKIFAREKLSGLPYAREVYEEVFYPMILKFFEVFRQGQKAGYIKPELNPALFFVIMSEGVWALFDTVDCDTPIRYEVADLTNNHEKLKEQLLSIYLKGVLT